jgi:hypothetical protein
MHLNAKTEVDPSAKTVSAFKLKTDSRGPDTPSR